MGWGEGCRHNNYTTHESSEEIESKLMEQDRVLFWRDAILEMVRKGRSDT